MYKITVLFISGSKKSAIVKVEKEFGVLTSVVAQGFIALSKPVEVGYTMELPSSTKVSTMEKSTVDKETGETTKFNWVVLD